MNSPTKYPTLLSYTWRDDGLTLTFRTPEGSTETAELGRKSSDAPFRLHSVGNAHDDLENWQGRLAFMIEGPVGMIAFILLVEDPNAVFADVANHEYPKPRAAVFYPPFLQAA